MKIDALLDSNVIIAMLVQEHQHHAASLALLANEHPLAFAVAAHSFAEAYTALTRRGEHAPFRFSPNEAWAALESVRAATALLGLSPAQTFDAIRGYAQAGGVGARLYDRLIGETAAVHGVPTIVTWNVGHMRGLFPSSRVVTPEEVTAGKRGET